MYQPLVTILKTMEFETRYFNDRLEWRSWLENNFEAEDEIWLEYPKKETGKKIIFEKERSIEMSAEVKDISRQITKEVERINDSRDFPKDIIHQVAKLSASAGKDMQKALNLVYKTEPNLKDQCVSRDLLYDELLKTAATCIKIMENMRNDNVRVRKYL